jgi:endonuclease I
MTTHVVVPYTSSSRVDVWDALQVLDADPTNPSKVFLTYSNVSVDGASYLVNNTWNREHIIPRSYGLFDTGPDFSDLHNLRATDSRVNSARNNLYFDDCFPESDSSCVQPAHALAASDTAKNKDKFMPSASERGDIARAVFYTALRYNGTEGTNPESNTVNIVIGACPCVAGHVFGNLTTLLRWHDVDPVSQREIARNNLTCSNYQVARPEAVIKTENNSNINNL